jgi:DNA-binding transcriptional LysR family regulator
MPGALTVNNSQAYEAACLAGLGLVQVPEVAFRHHLVQGVLVDVLPEYRAEPMPVSLVYAQRGGRLHGNDARRVARSRGG